ncbi:MAG: SlyX family protein [Phycisphaerales bacterium]
MSDERLTRLEESVAFGERAGETLSAEVAELARRMEELARRLGSIEGRLSRLIDAKTQSLAPGDEASGEQ